MPVRVMPIPCAIYTFVSAFRPLPIFKQEIFIINQAWVCTGPQKMNDILIVYNPK